MLNYFQPPLPLFYVYFLTISSFFSMYRPAEEMLQAESAYNGSPRVYKGTNNTIKDSERAKT